MDNHLDSAFKNPPKLTKEINLIKLGSNTSWRHYSFDRIVHPEYHSINVGEDEKSVKKSFTKRQGHVVMGPYSILHESDDFVCIQRYTRIDKYNFISMISAVSYGWSRFTLQTARNAGKRSI